MPNLVICIQHCGYRNGAQLLEFQAAESSAGDERNGTIVVPDGLAAAQVNTRIITEVATRFRDEQAKVFAPNDKATIYGAVTDVSTIPGL